MSLEASTSDGAAFQNPDDQRQQIDVWLRYLKQNETSCKEEIAARQKELSEYDDLKNKITDMTKKLEKHVFIPVGRMAFLPGTLDRTNEFHCLIGDNTFVKKSSFRTFELLERRQNVIKEHIKKTEEELKLVEQRKQFAEQLLEHSSQDAVEIREPYDEAKEGAGKKRRREHDVTRTEHEDLMKHLDALEEEEARNHELDADDRDKTADNRENMETVSHLSNPIQAASVVEGKPSQISDADYKKLLRYLDKLDAQDEEEDEEALLESDEDDKDVTDSDDQEEQENIITTRRVGPLTPVAPTTLASPAPAKPSIVQPKKSGGPKPTSAAATTKPSPNTTPSTGSAAAKPSDDSIPTTTKKKGVRFNETPLGPTASSSSVVNEKTGEPPAPAPPILKPIDYVPRVDRQAVEAMDRRDQTVILPESKSALTGPIRERDPLNVLPELKDEAKPKVSRFRATRIGK